MFATLHSSVSLLTMNIATGHNIFITSTPATYQHEAPSRQGSCGRSVREATTVGHQPSNQQVPVGAGAEFTDLQTVKQVLEVLKEGKMDVVVEFVVCGRLSSG